MSSASVCPFLAIATDSGRRLPDAHVTHACFAQRPALAIELDHQAQFCLTSSFPTCPAFVAWAAREAAQPVSPPKPLPIEQLAAASRDDEDLGAPLGGDDTIWSMANATLPPLSPEDEERARVVPLHQRRSVEDELPKVLVRLPRALSSARSFAALVVFVGVVLFAAPSIMKGIGGFLNGIGEDPTPSASATVEPSASPTPTPTPEPIVHVVKAGETLSGISQRYMVSIEVILGANPQVTNPNNLNIGERLIIPNILPNVEVSPSP